MGPRDTSDSTLNEYGRELLQICQAYNLSFLNGRVGSVNQLANFTCITSQGCSMVDYAIVSELLLHEICNFQVNDPSPHSDHCSLSLVIKSKPTLEADFQATASSLLLSDMQQRAMHDIMCTDMDDPTQALAPRYKMGKDNRVAFTQSLQSEEWRKELLNIEKAPGTSSQIKRLQSGIISQALDSGFLIQRSSSTMTNSTRKVNPIINQSWHDHQCFEAKRRLRDAMRCWSNSKRDVQLLQTMLQKKRDYKSLCRNKKRNYKDSFCKSLLDLQKKKPRDFWSKFKGKKRAAQSNIAF